MRGKRPHNYSRTAYQCVQCGKEVLRAASTVKKSVFCGRECADLHKVGQPSPFKHIPDTRACKTCGTSFTVKPNSTQQHCSKKCGRVGAGLSISTIRLKMYVRHTIPCAWCGKPVEKRPSEIRKNNYCSRSCLGSATSDAQKGRRSKPEFVMEQALKDAGETFEAQHRIGRWVVDFFLPERNLVIEVDGDYWHRRPEVAARDRRKNADLLGKGVQVERVWESDVKQDAAGALAMILQRQ